jgi:FAD/FMN-containing dehydrogenase
MSRQTGYRSWGRPSVSNGRRAIRLRWRDEALPLDGGPFLPFGNGRSYGDSCLNGGGALIDMRGLDRFISFEPHSGVLRCEAGVLLNDILARFVPDGWFLPVTPGTRFVTIGGAIANDVHGKNHHRGGSFGHHVRGFELLRSDGTRLICSPTTNADWFAATIGGLGLTGVITWAEIALKPIPGPAVDVETIRFTGIDEFLDLSRAAHNSHEYTVAWVDALSKGGLRGLFFRGNHARADGPLAAPRRRPGLPVTPPFSLLPKPAVRLFNSAIYRLPRRPRQKQHYEVFFYPLDGIADWNRLYGRKGFFQYQCVIPSNNADAIRELVDRVAQTQEASFLSVLKVFGDQPAAGWLSFARPGITLALDLPDRGKPTQLLLDRLDEITREAGGAVYPAKDARMSPATFERGYPNWRRLEQYRDPALLSDFWRRTTGVGHG